MQNDENPFQVVDKRESGGEQYGTRGPIFVWAAPDKIDINTASLLSTSKRDNRWEDIVGSSQHMMKKGEIEYNIPRK